MNSFQPLSLDHTNILQKRLKNIQIPLSEFSFANLYLFRNIHNYQVSTENNCICITGLTSDKKHFALPLCDTNNLDINFLTQLLRQHHMIFPIAEEWLEFFDINIFNISHCLNDSDYIFETSKLASLSGRKLHKKRNLVKQFHNKHKYEFKVLSANSKDLAIQILNKWQDNSSFDKSKSDYQACLEAINLKSELELEGEIYIVDGQPAGFVLGEALTKDTFALHFCKALTDYTGIYQFIFNDYAQSLVERFDYINFEQDLGIQSLRQAKSSYIPLEMLNKYRIELK